MPGSSRKSPDVWGAWTSFSPVEIPLWNDCWKASPSWRHACNSSSMPSFRDLRNRCSKPFILTTWPRRPPRAWSSSDRILRKVDWRTALPLCEAPHCTATWAKVNKPDANIASPTTSPSGRFRSLRRITTHVRLLHSGCLSSPALRRGCEFDCNPRPVSASAS